MRRRSSAPRPPSEGPAASPRPPRPRSSRRQLAAARDQRRALHAVHQLAHVAGPVVREQRLVRGLREPPARRRPARPAAAGSARPAGSTSCGRSAQRRHRQLDHVEPEEQVLRGRAPGCMARAGRRWWRPARARPPAASRWSRAARTRRSAARAAAWPGPPGERLPISSRNSVPPSAASKRPTRRLVAPVKAPASAPNSSLSSSSSGRAPALTFTNGLSWRRELAWTISASFSLPTPFGPRDQHGRVGAPPPARPATRRGAWPRSRRRGRAGRGRAASCSRSAAPGAGAERRPCARARISSRARTAASSLASSQGLAR